MITTAQHQPKQNPAIRPTPLERVYPVQHENVCGDVGSGVDLTAVPARRPAVGEPESVMGSSVSAHPTVAANKHSPTPDTADRRGDWPMSVSIANPTMTGKKRVVSGTAPPSMPRSKLLQRKCTCGVTSSRENECEEGRAENLGMQRQGKNASVRTELAIGATDDPVEHEADRVADQVLSGPRNSVVTGVPPLAQAFTTSPTVRDDAVPGSVHQVLARTGLPLEPGLRYDMEQRFGYDFSHVRVHTDSVAARSASDIRANAYTVGRDIVFGAGKYAPTTHTGRRLLAHELTHVVQQQGAGVQHADASSAATARQTPKQQRPIAIARVPGPRPNETPMTETELLELLVRLRGQAFSKPGAPAEDPAVPPVGRGVGPQAGGRAAGDAVFAAIQITDKDGKLVDRSVGAYFGGRDKHAEEQALANLERAIAGRNVEGGELLAVVDQEPCDPSRRDCGGNILKFARRFKLRTRIRVPTRESAQRGAPAGTLVRPKPAARGAQRTDFPAVKLRDFHPGEQVGQPVASSESGGETPAPVTPPAQPAKAPAPKAAGGTPSGGGETPVPVSPPAQPAKSPGAAKVPRLGLRGVMKGVGGAVAGSLLSLGLAFIFGRIQQGLDQRRIQAALERMEPEISTALNRLQAQVEQLLQQTNMQQTIYGNIQVDVIYSWMIDPDGPPMIDYQSTQLVAVAVSTQDINREDLIRKQVGIVGHDDHHRYTYSVPIAAPAAVVLPAIRTLHDYLIAIRNDLIAARGGTSGEAVAVDYLNVAEQATDYAGPSSFQNKSADERYRSTLDAITRSLSVLEAPARGNRSVQSVMQSLQRAKFIADGLASRWLVMIEESGQQP